MTCLIIGDSLAVGVGQFRPECDTVAKVGITSQTYLATRFPAQGVAADTVVISLGVNDGDTSGTLENLLSLRTRVQAGSVYWLLPGLKEEVRDAIREVAREYGDQLIDTRPEVGRDHLHPNGAGYQRLAAQTMDNGRGEVEVAYAPTDMNVRTSAGQNYPPRLHVSSNIGPASPRERIRRLKQLRSADKNAPPVRPRSLQHEAHMGFMPHPVASARINRCLPAWECQASVKPAVHIEPRKFTKRERVQARTIAFQR